MNTCGTWRTGKLFVGALALLLTLGGCVRTVAPTVSSTDPAGGATGVAVNKSVSAVFSDAMDPSTINATTFTLKRGSTPVAGSVTYSGVTATFNPTSNLAPNTLYTATISMGAEALGSSAKFIPGEDLADEEEQEGEIGPDPDDDLDRYINHDEEHEHHQRHHRFFTLLLLGSLFAGQGGQAVVDGPLAEDFVWSFTTGAGNDSVAPTVTETIPANDATNVALGGNLSITFSESMNPATINAATITLSRGGTSIPGAVSYAGVTATFNPTALLASGTEYTATVTTGARDQAGNALASNFVWSFTTGAANDTTAPTIISTFPDNGTLGALPGQNVSATFSEAMNPLTISSATFTLSRGLALVPATVTYSGTTAVLNPTTELDPEAIYVARVTTGAQDLAGNALGMDFLWVFTTGEANDTTNPTVSSTTPPNGGLFVAIGSNLVATFSEPMDRLSINSTTFRLTRGGTPIAGTVSYSGVSATFNPTASLAPVTLYVARITTGANDPSGNPLLVDYTWAFTTGAAPDSIPPRVSSTVPTNGAANAPLGGNLTATFTEAMDPASINANTFTLSQGATRIPGLVSYAGVTASFNPTAPLLPNTIYSARITSGARDLADNELLVDYVWTFATGNVVDSRRPEVSSTFPANGATNVALGGNLSATFSETMNPFTITPLTFTLLRGATAVYGSVTYAGVTATLNPVTALLPNTKYTATIAREVRDLAGNTMFEDFVWSFTTGATPDTTPPTVISTVPANAAIGVAIGGNLSATFSEPMNPLTINSATFTLDRGLVEIVGTVTYSGVTATFNPNSPLAPNSFHTAAILMEATDLAGNELLLDYAWAFTTGAVADTVAPTLVSTVPIDGAIGVPLGGNVSATFSEPMNPLTITPLTFTLDRGATPVLGTVTYAGNTATFNPLTALLINTTYTATVWMEATDLAGNSLSMDEEWTFTTGVTTAAFGIQLGSANAFAVLAGSTVSNTGPSIVTGDLGVSPGTAVEGFPPGVLIGATFTGVGSAAGQAKVDLNSAFDDAAGQSTGAVSLPGDLSGLTLFPGLYANSTSVMLSVGSVTLDAQGDSNAVFLFQMGSTLTTGTSTQVILAGGAKAANI